MQPVVELRQALRRRKPQRWACRVARFLSVGWFDHIRNLDTSLVVVLRGICSGLGLSEGGIVYGLFSKEALYFGKASVDRTHCPGLAARLTEHIRCLHRPGLKHTSKPRYRLLRRRLWSVRFFPLAVFQQSPKHQQRKHWRYRWRLRWAMRARDVVEERHCAARERRPRSWLLVDGPAKGDHGKVFGVVRLSKKLCETSSGASQFSFQVRWNWTLLFPLFTQLRYEKNMRIVGLKGPSICLIPVGWGYSCCIARKVRIVRTFRGSRCRGGLGGRLLHICMGHANKFPNFLSFPSSVLHPEFWNISCVFFLCHRKEFQCFGCLQSSRILGMSKENSTRLLVACGAGLLADGCKRIWMRARRAARGGCGSSVVRGSFETCSPRSSRIGTSTSLPMRWCCAACEPCQGLEIAGVGAGRRYQF